MVSAVRDTTSTERQAGIGEPVAATTLIDAHLLNRNDLRLDAGYYNTTTMQALRAMESSGLRMQRLGEVTENIFIPPRFKRVYVDQAHGVPFLQGSHLVHFRPADLKYLSRSAHKNLDRWIIKSGWVLVTCSGTIGRVAIALQQWDGWAASQHILRIVPKDDRVPAGYIYAWLRSPFGQAQFNGIYGAVIDEVTADHVKDILIPVPETPDQIEAVNAINALVADSLAAKELALAQDASAVEMAGDLIQVHCA